jgi:hypothetical protein
MKLLEMWRRGGDELRRREEEKAHARGRKTRGELLRDARARAEEKKMQQRAEREQRREQQRPERETRKRASREREKSADSDFWGGAAMVDAVGQGHPFWFLALLSSWIYKRKRDRERDEGGDKEDA